MKEDLFKAIIIKFLKGDATPHEKGMLANWLKEDPEREEIFYYYLSTHESESPQYFPEVASKIETYEKFLRGEIQMPKVDYHNEGGERNQSKIISYRWWLAASVLLFFSASLYFLKDPFLYKTYAADYGTIKSVTLEDGSAVTLSANSSIKILRDFMDHENREVWIKGEAFFEVSKKTNRMKFIVHTDNFDVEVLGTKFNVNNRRGKTEVMLAEGKVKLMAKDHEPLIMNPGEQVSLSNKHEHFEKQVANTAKHEAWRKNKLVFKDTPLAEVAEVVQDYYGVKVIITDSLLATRQFTGTLPNNDLDVILLALRTSYKIEIEQSNEYIILK
jgi:transmembrane sensor